MKTDELINILSTNVEPVGRRQLARNLYGAMAAGTLGALIAVILTLGVRPDLNNAEAFAFLALKLVFTAGVVAVAFVFMANLVRPGGEWKVNPTLAALPFAAIVLLASISLASAPSSHWDTMIVGDMWLECLVSIPTIAVLPFVTMIRTVRRLAAPTDLGRTGAFIGLVAGGVSAMGYALHCTDDSLPFIALWYGGTIVLCTLAGAILGPRLLRW